MTNRLLYSIMSVMLSLNVSSQELRLANIISDNMVLQQKSSVKIWGWASKDSHVKLLTSWDGKSYTAQADKQGRWEINVQTTVAGGPYSMEVESGKRIKVNNIYLGEVWLTSGQSNMSMPLKGYENQPVKGSTQAILKSKGRKIHYINIPTLASYKPLDDFKGAGWYVASLETTADCCAVGWFFADIINGQLDVPVGIINASFSGSNLESWMPGEACKPFPDIKVPKPSDETSPWIGNVPTLLYNGMIHPVQGYGLRGLLWYQGESNIFNVPQYAPAFAEMVKQWRILWNQGEFPCYYVQIAPYDYKEWNFFTPQWLEISAYQREAQLKAQSLIPNSGMVVTLDLGEEKIIHYPDKSKVGERLALMALAKTYGKKNFECESPAYERMEIKEGKAVIYFKNAFNGITSYGKPLTLFEIAGENKVFMPAEAYIDEGNGTVVVHSRLVKEPKAVRYAFKDFVRGELFGTGGMPVSSFRTDNYQ